MTRNNQPQIAMSDTPETDALRHRFAQPIFPHYAINVCMNKLEELEKGRNQLIAQRDMLVGALLELKHGYTDKAERMAVEALAAVKGGSDE